MATVNKDFKIKSGLVVEGLQGTINGEVILTENAGDQYILDLIGGETLVKSVEATQLEVSGAGKLSVKANVFDASGAAAQALTDAEDYADGLAVNYDAAGAAATAQSNAEDYADGLAVNYDVAGAAATVAGDLTDHENATAAHGATGAVVGTTNTQTLTNKTIGDTLNFTGAGAMTINSDSHIVLTPAAGSSVKWGSDVLATQDYADTAADTAANNAETDAKDYTDLLIGDATIDGTGGNTVAARISQAVADLVDSAPEALDTLNELAAAMGDDVDLVTGLATSIGNKLPLAGGSMSGAIAMGTNKITGLGTPTANADAATKEYADGVAATAQSNAEDYADGLAVNYDPAGTAAGLAGNYDAAGSAATAQSNAEDYADGLAVNYDAAGAAATAQSNAEDYADGLAVNYEPAGAINTAIDALDTDDIEEGTTNNYFTSTRAKIAAAELITGASKTNITITGDENGLTISAENGVADSDTDDLEEGLTNLYFTDERAVDALEAVVPNFTAVEVNSLAKEVAVTATISTVSTATALTWDTTEYRTVKALVKFATATHTEVSEVLLTLDGLDNIAITEYAMVGTNGSMGTVTATVVAGEGRLNVTTLNNATVVFVKATLLV